MDRIWNAAEPESPYLELCAKTNRVPVPKIGEKAFSTVATAKEYHVYIWDVGACSADEMGETMVITYDMPPVRYKSCAYPGTISAPWDAAAPLSGVDLENYSTTILENATYAPLNAYYSQPNLLMRDPSHP